MSYCTLFGTDKFDWSGRPFHPHIATVIVVPYGSTTVQSYTFRPPAACRHVQILYLKYKILCPVQIVTNLAISYNFLVISFFFNVFGVLETACQVVNLHHQIQHASLVSERLTYFHNQQSHPLPLGCWKNISYTVTTIDRS